MLDTSSAAPIPGPGPTEQRSFNMQPQPEHSWRLQLEMDVEMPPDLDVGGLIPVLHRIIQQRALDEIWIDVVDYRHVGDGPSLLLVSHDAYYGIEHNARRSTVLYRRRRPHDGAVHERLREAADRLLRFAEYLQDEEPLGGADWRSDRWILSLHDRLLAPGGAPLGSAFESALECFQHRLWGPQEVTRRQGEDPAGPMAVAFSAEMPEPLGTLRHRLTLPWPPVQDAVRPGSPQAAESQSRNTLTGAPS